MASTLKQKEIMEEVNVQKTVSARRVGNTQVVDESVVRSETADPQEFTLAKLGQIVMYLAHFIAIILGLRFVFLLLGANLRGIVLFIYNISQVFIMPFRGIFPSPTTGESYFDSAALLGIFIYYLLAFLIMKGLALFSRDTTA